MYCRGGTLLPRGPGERVRLVIATGARGSRGSPFYLHTADTIWWLFHLQAFLYLILTYETYATASATRGEAQGSIRRPPMSKGRSPGRWRRATEAFAAPTASTWSIRLHDVRGQSRRSLGNCTFTLSLPCRANTCLVRPDPALRQHGCDPPTQQSRVPCPSSPSPSHSALVASKALVPPSPFPLKPRPGKLRKPSLARF